MFYVHASKIINSKVDDKVKDNIVEVREDISTQYSLRNENRIDNKYFHDVITEEQLLEKLIFFNTTMIHSGGYIGLKKFVTEYLANQDFEINHTYAIINNLVEKNQISISTIFDDSLGYYVKAVEIL